MSTTLPLPDPASSNAPGAWARLGLSMRRRYREPLLDGLTPQVQVHVLLADGSQATWRPDQPLKPLVSPSVAQSSGGLTAIEYPEDRLLRRQLTLPDMPVSEVAQAAELDAVTSSPFRSDDLVWGHRCIPQPSGQLQVDVVLASRKQVQQYLEQQADRIAGRMQPETWVEVWAPADSSSSQPIVFQGFGESVRVRRQARQRWLLSGLLFVTWCLLMGIAITPTAQLRLRAIEAVAAFDALQQRTAALVLKRESLSKTAEQLAALDAILSERVQAVEVIGVLTRALPDDTSLISLQMQGSKIRISGQTPNTADLMQKLSAYPGLRDVKAPTAATRPLGVNKESFSLELELTPEALRASEPGRAASAAAIASAPAPKASSPWK